MKAQCQGAGGADATRKWVSSAALQMWWTLMRARLPSCLDLDLSDHAGHSQSISLPGQDLRTCGKDGNIQR